MPKQVKPQPQDIEEQVAALPLRLAPDGAIEVLLVTSRETRRWVLPKGNLMKSLKRAEAAAVEAREEAGVIGRVIEEPYRHFDYWKRRSDAFYFCRVDVFLLVVSDEAKRWKEQHQRERRWVSLTRAYEMVVEPGLQSIFRQLGRDPSVVDLLLPKAQRSGQRSWSEVVRSLTDAG